MDITFLNQSSETSWKEYKKYLSPLLKETLHHVKHDDKVSVSVVLVHDAQIHEYNKAFRDIDTPTDVLSFPDGDCEEGITNLGDIVISVDALRRQAQEYQHSLKREFSFLVVHGYLHLLGYDHHTQEEEHEMFTLQKEILDALDIRRS
ncbi:rRNA maturation RNase YbeY [Erysipelothrix larvae]|uniref:Endoribonuclease YbeY n=1 Tax=Erysipelothrix larvae TaxID=1514105 RepID=A0A0X8GZL9_9FIRM|nr:rRNA maturation RNase YbeY [Erysipelothrix larvae]AMC93369.1 rRNA maturation RNase YbeY [Erysipelothrix larvae]